MQEDKEGVFDAAREPRPCRSPPWPAWCATCSPDAARLEAAAGAGFSTATDLADWLVRELRMPFRDAHHVTGRLVARAEAQGRATSPALTLDEMQAEEPRITEAVFGVLTVAASVASRTSFGGTAPENVRRMAAEWREKLA